MSPLEYSKQKNGKISFIILMMLFCHVWRTDYKNGKSKSKIVKSQLQYSMKDDSDSNQVTEVKVKKK